MYMTENIGRDGQAKAKRKLEAKDADKALKALLERDKEGMQTVIKAREAGALKEGKDVKQSGKGKDRKDNTSQRTILDDEVQRKTSYSAEFVKSLGFNPSLKAGQRMSNSKHVQEKVWKAIECFSLLVSHQRRLA
jgi:minichromosome maintenance protein 10